MKRNVAKNIKEGRALVNGRTDIMFSELLEIAEHSNSRLDANTYDLAIDGFYMGVAVGARYGKKLAKKKAISGKKGVI